MSATGQPDDYYGAIIRERNADEAAALLADECRKKDRALALVRHCPCCDCECGCVDDGCVDDVEGKG